MAGKAANVELPLGSHGHPQATGRVGGSCGETNLEFVPQEFVDNFLLLIGGFITELGEEPDPTILILSLQ